MEPALLIDAEDFQNNARLKQKLDGVLQLWADGSRLGEAGAARVVQALAHDIEIRQPLGMAVDEADREILQLSDSQLGILRLLSATRRVAISGPAGSGKTLLAAEKAKRLAADGFRTYPVTR
jgi:superfamily II DNA or RNA helicase